MPDTHAVAPPPMPSGDDDLVAADRRLAELLTEARALAGSGDDAEIWDRIFELRTRISRTPAAGIAGAVVKLRCLLDPELGIEGGHSRDDAPALRDVLAAIEREPGIDRWCDLDPGFRADLTRALFADPPDRSAAIRVCVALAGSVCPAAETSIADARRQGEPAEEDPAAVAALSADDGTRAGDDDDKVLELFKEWLRLSDLSDDPDRETETDAIPDARDEIEDRIFACSGAVALAVKVYFVLREEHGEWAPRPAMFCWSLVLDDPDGYTQQISMARDAAALVPELAQLMAPFLDRDAVLLTADIKIGWCRDRLAGGGRHDLKHLRKVRSELGAALDLVAATEAKTARGAAIKARHAAVNAAAGEDAERCEDDPAVAIERRWLAAVARSDAIAAECAWADAGVPGAAAQAARARCDAAVEAASDTEDRLADVVATSLPGLRAQLAYLGRYFETRRFTVRLCQAAIAGLDAMIEGAAAPVLADTPDWGQPPPDLAALLRQLRLIEATLEDDRYAPGEGYAGGERLNEDDMPLNVTLCRHLIAGAEAIAAVAGLSAS